MEREGQPVRASTSEASDSGSNSISQQYGGNNNGESWNWQGIDMLLMHRSRLSGEEGDNRSVSSATTIVGEEEDNQSVSSIGSTSTLNDESVQAADGTWRERRQERSRREVIDFGRYEVAADGTWRERRQGGPESSK
jgi:hypothetical protein